MPATLKINPGSRHPETGVNLSLEDTVRIMKDDGQTVEMWGPYEVRHSIWERFSVQKAFLETGRLGYQCVDTWGESARLGNGCDCIHAITDMDPTYPRSRYPLMWFGPPATYHVVRRIASAGGFVDVSCNNDWLLGPLNLTDSAIVRRTLPRTGLLK
jgi:hypothetical protein